LAQITHYRLPRKQHNRLPQKTAPFSEIFSENIFLIITLVPDPDRNASPEVRLLHLPRHRRARRHARHGPRHRNVPDRTRASGHRHQPLLPVVPGIDFTKLHFDPKKYFLDILDTTQKQA
jgi:hypothetical protein